MANYKEEIGTGVAWTRCKTVSIENPVLEKAYVNFIETKCAMVGDFASEQFVGTISKEFDPTAVINLRNPETGELTGQTTTHADLYVAIYSLYIQSALERDEALANQVPVQLPPLFPIQEQNAQ